MKYLVFILTASLAISGLFSCQKLVDERKPLFQSDKKPLPVTGVQVKNMEGAAVITYKLPEDPSVLYVQADYMINDKIARQEKVSYYSDSIRVSGFAKAGEYKVILYSVSRSEVKSDSVVVKVNPLNPPYRTIAASLQLYDAFGGVNVKCQNPTEGEVGVGVVVDTTGRPELVYTEYTKATAVEFTVRGFSLKPYRMGAYVIDRWGNVSDTTWKTITPLYEAELQRAGKIVLANLPQDGAMGNVTVFTDIINFTGSSTRYYSINKTAPAPNPYLGLYLGVTAKLSRFKFYPRSDMQFTNGTPRVFEVWVSMTPGATGDLYDGTWTKLGRYEVIKPSGLPIGTNSTEDVNAANAGFEFVFPLPAVACKYVRIVGIDTWKAAPDGNLKIGPIHFWGDNR
ncbi:DUF4959 domain-containing protein [Flavisolibacter tropicus]|uniref:DUF4959 domain-containing protein n=1 Tax=Flavisolibacter tropicus TaxID=1492898 RepID=A0A172TXA9_9BACT|nr:DUF4959 domain-containing protein [Flavisolibacter tropicus]ANE51413.1 hypothetical protein SY85_13770 [Flavisolibacter tropicus]